MENRLGRSVIEDLRTTILVSEPVVRATKAKMTQ